MSAHDDFWTLFDAATTVPIIFANGNGPRPPKPYATLQLSVAQPQPAHHGRVNEEGIRPVSAHRSASVQIQVYGEGSWGIAESLAMTLHTDRLQMLAEELNLTINENIRIQDVPMLMDNSTYEPRAILDLQATYTAHIDEDVGFIETVRGKAFVDDLAPQNFEATLKP